MEDLREEYDGKLNPDAVDLNAPLAMLETWIHDAQMAGLSDPTAMCLATLGPDGGPRSRMVLCKGVHGASVRFFTNLTSDKAQQLHADERASLTFWWPDADRSVRLVVRVEPLGRADVEAYFATRPRASQLGAWVSDQSSPIADRSALEAKREDVHARFEGSDVPCPPHWGGFIAHAHEVEYWAGRPARLHDRIRLRLDDGVWTKERLQP
ncbi:MAG: pyridoxamine 5'-phosphate oxidase [Candidatus Poseidoniaceae archaeon]|nr:pyridoxamine 5'-phosphate oxidase [Candidatus Poseidoniaceae archaeon]